MDFNISRMSVLFLCYYPIFAGATADGPDFFQSNSGITEIQVFENPQLNSKQMKSIKAPVLGLRNLGCKGEISFSEWERLDEPQKSKLKENIWCKIAYHETEGWVQNQDLAEDSQSRLPLYNCAQTTREIEILICNYQELIELDYLLQDTYNQALKRAASLGDHPQKAVKELKTIQRGWVKGRNDCWKALENKFECVKSNYEDRIAYLQAKWVLLKPSFTNRYLCTSNQAEFVVTFYPTKPIASAAVELGDKRKIFLQNDLKDKNHYNGEFGQYMDLKDNAAFFVWDQSKPGITCDISK